MEPTVRGERRGALRFTATSAALLVLALLLAVVLRNVFAAAHRVIGWGVATAVVAILLKPPVEWLSRFVPRVLALLLAGACIAGVAGVLVYGVFDDLQSETQALRERGPAAAASLEDRDDRIGDVARDLQLQERAEDAFETLEDRFGVDTEVLASAAGRVPSYFVCFILTIFFVLYGSRMVEGALGQVADPSRRQRLADVVHEGVAKGRGYLWFAILQGAVVGSVTYAFVESLDLPAPTVLGLAAAVAAFVPYIGIVIGALPVVLTAAGLESPAVGGAFLAVAVTAQAVEATLVRRAVDRRTLHVGPAIPVIVGSIGLEMYGIGGALYGAGVAVLLLAMADAAATDAEEPLPTPNLDWTPDEAGEPEPGAAAEAPEPAPAVSSSSVSSSSVSSRSNVVR